MLRIGVKERKGTEGSVLGTCLVIMFSICITSCTTTYETANKHYDLAQSCCRDFSEFTYETLSQTEPLAFDIDQTSPAFNFTSGKSYFKALKLPDLPLPYSLSIRSYAQGEMIDKAHIFFPRILLLKEDFSVAREVDPAYVVEKSNAGAIKENKWGLPVRLSGQIRIENTESKYLLVITTDELLLTGIQWTQVMTGLAEIGFYLGFGKEGSFVIPGSPFGRVALGFEPLKEAEQ